MNSSDRRYAAHPTFKFSVTNIKQREKIMSSTLFNIQQMPEEEPMTRDGIQYTFRNHDNTIILSTNVRKIAFYGRNIVGSLPYCWA